MPYVVSVVSSSLLLNSIKRNLFVYRDDSLVNELEGYHMLNMSKTPIGSFLTVPWWQFCFGSL